MRLVADRSLAMLVKDLPDQSIFLLAVRSRMSVQGGTSEKVHLSAGPRVTLYKFRDYRFTSTFQDQVSLIHGSSHLIRSRITSSQADKLKTLGPLEQEVNLEKTPPGLVTPKLGEFQDLHLNLNHYPFLRVVAW